MRRLLHLAIAGLLLGAVGDGAEGRGFGGFRAGGFAAGGLFYACFAAYSHQLQHEKPELCFWLPRPVHYIHHHEKMWHHNFGISIDLWDRVFGTYKKVDWHAEPGKWSFRGYFTIKWV